MSSSDRIVSNKVLFELVRDGEATSKRVQSISGTFGEAVKNAVETKHLHAGAFGLMNRLNKMDEAKRNDFLASAEVYIQKMREGPWKQGHVGDFVAQAEAAEREEERARQAAASDEERAASVARIETGIKMDDPDDPGKVTTIAEERKKQQHKRTSTDERVAARIAAASEKPAAHRPGRAPRAGKADVKEAAERAFKKQDEKLATDRDAAQDQIDEAHAEGQRRHDEAGNTLPPDISGEDWDSADLRESGEHEDAVEHVGMPGAEPRAPVH